MNNKPYLLIKDKDGNLVGKKPEMEEPNKDDCRNQGQWVNWNKEWQDHLQSLPSLHLDPSIKGKEGDRVDGVEHYEIGHYRHPDEPMVWSPVSKKEYDEANEVMADTRITLKGVDPLNEMLGKGMKTLEETVELLKSEPLSQKAVAEKEEKYEIIVEKFVDSLKENHKLRLTLNGLAEYLRRELSKGTTHFIIATHDYETGNHWYIHPEGKAGETHDLYFAEHPDQSQEAQRQGAEEITAESFFDTYFDKNDNVATLTKFAIIEFAELYHKSKPSPSEPLREALEKIIENLSGWEDTDTFMGIAIENARKALSNNL